MPTTTKTLKRVFEYKGTSYPDPAPTSPAEAVLDILSHANPEFTNAVLEGPTIEGDRQVYNIKVGVGTKG